MQRREQRGESDRKSPLANEWIQKKNSDHLFDFSSQLPTNVCSHNNHLTDPNTLWNKLVKKCRGSVRFKHLNHGVKLGMNEGFAEHLFVLFFSH